MQHTMDAIEADPSHYELLFENDQVRALRIRFDPGERSQMHSHPASTLVFLTDGQVRFHLPDGNHFDESLQAGQARWVPATTHLPENVGTEPFELIHLEILSPHA